MSVEMMEADTIEPATTPTGAFSADRLLELYDRVAEAPDAVERLRRFVLDLAVRGRLVEQDPEDEPASELLKRIEKEKERMVKAGEIRKQKRGTPLDADEHPFSLPSGWTWSQIAEIGVISPRNEAPDDLEVSFVSMSMIAAEYGIANEHETRRWGEIKKGYTHFSEGDVGLAKITPCFENGKSTVFRNLTGGIGAGTTELHVVRPISVLADYIILFLKSPYFIETGILLMTGTAGHKRVPKDYFTSSPFPLPPLAEQHRIVARVDDLMSLLDRLEEARTTREATRDRLTAAALTRLAAPDAATPHIRLVLNNLSALTTRPDQIKTLRQTILNLAIRGMLVEQDPEDEPAQVLLERIAEEKEQFPAPRRRGKTLVDPSLTELRFGLPNGWESAKLSDLVRVLNGRAYKKTELLEEGTPVLRVGNLFTSDHWYYSDLELEDDKYCDRGDLIYAWSASFGPFIWDGPRAIFHYHIWKLPLFSECDLDKQYLYLYLLQKTREIKEAGHGISMVHMTKGKMEDLAVPLPPLAEQHRIVAKVDELMELCDRLEGLVAEAEASKQTLLEAVCTPTH